MGGQGPPPWGGFAHEGGDAGDVAAPVARVVLQSDVPAVVGQALLLGVDGRPQGGQSWVEHPYAVAVGGEAQT